ncbi:class I SAM-dependent methyltransferase [Halotia wernerae UHCC 0503]|jgi:ubiquinone/menaquinone biosynthesis C-methylase UbiE|nr:class I SAM-dependent methyltransferase [Halotia wernerae UHCC 0503]
MRTDPPTHRPFEAFQEFLLSCKLQWTRNLYPEVAQRYRAAAEAAPAKPQTVADVEKLIANDTTYRYFAWFERHLQKMKYSGRYGLAGHYGAHRDELAPMIETASNDRLVIPPDFAPPEYYPAIDIHQHPGGVHGDSVAGMVYERGARTTTPLLDKHGDLHQRFTRIAMERLGKQPKRVVDMGCGFGKSTRPFYSSSRDTEVVGVDLAAPCVKLAAHTAAEDQARNVQFRQGDAADTKLPAGNADLVTSTMMLHEMPVSHIEKVLHEAHRLLAPGGWSIHLDFLAGDDPFNKFIHYGHSARNNEPFMPPLDQMDLTAAHRRAGFDKVEIMRFEEMTGALSPENKAWRFPWVVIAARKAA